jgi:hypothetical protein
VHTGFWWGDLRESDHLEDLDVNGTIGLKLIFKNLDGETGCFNLAQNRDSLRAFVNTAMNLRVS